MKKLEEKTQEGKLYKYKQLHLFLKDNTDLFTSKDIITNCKVLKSKLPFKHGYKAARNEISSHVRRLNKYYKGDLSFSHNDRYAYFTYKKHPTEIKLKGLDKLIEQAPEYDLTDCKPGMIIREPVKPDESYEPTFDLTIKDGSVFFLFVLLGAIGGFLLTLYLFVL